MGIKEEIYDEFFEKLQGEKEISESLILELKKLKDNGKITEGNLTEIIERGCGDGSESEEG